MLLFLFRHFLFWCLFLQDHLISSQFFVFIVVFCFCLPALSADELEATKRELKVLAFSFLESSCERLCEVEFWEVLRLKMCEGVFNDVTLDATD